MAKDNSQLQAARRRRHTTVTSLFNTIEWLIIALILAFTFRAFILEAFRIPTGSMAPTLRGDHFEIACPQCGHEYDYGFIPNRYTVRANIYSTNPGSRCPNCGLTSKLDVPKSNGDRILVFKGIYHFTDPKRWDVFVFKNPTEPKINYIKRCVGLPGEKFEIVDGDIYINDEITRKPEKVQQEVWMEIYNNNLQPAKPFAGNFNDHTWKQPFVNKEGSNWDLTKDNSRTFSIDSSPDKIDTIYYDTTIGNDFKATYGYNEPWQYELRPIASDLMTKMNLTATDQPFSFGVSLTKYDRDYIAKINSAGQMTLTRIIDGIEEELNSTMIEPIPADKPVEFKFANVDHELVFNFGPYELKYDLGKSRDDLGERNKDQKPGVEILGSGKCEIENVAIYRDIHYTSIDYRGQIARGGEGNPFILGEDEFFACGDNSPNSADSRMWTRAGFGNNGHKYPEGVVPRDYLVGKAFYVYWPSGYKPTLNPKWSKFKLASIPLIPDISKMKLIYGGE